MTEQLAPATLDAENLPGPVRTPAHGAGEHHPYEESFPRVLDLGEPYDGSDKTSARLLLHRMTQMNRIEAARRALLVECGVPWVPMEAIAA